MTSDIKPMVNPLSRRPRQQRLVLGLRGEPGSGKSHFVASMAESGSGRLCVFDVERKTRLIEGVNTRFDSYEINEPDELPAFIEYFLNGEGRARDYGCYALDSFSHYFAAKYAETLEALRARTNDPLAKPDAEQLQATQILLQGVLRKLVGSGRSVVITDVVPSKGRDTVEDNEGGRLLPHTLAGLEAVVDVLCDVDIEERGGDFVRVFRVAKTNSPVFPIGLEFVGDTVTFSTFLDRLREGTEVPVDAPRPLDVPELLKAPAPLPASVSPEVLLDRAAKAGISQARLSVRARALFRQPSVYRLDASQIASLLAWVEEVERPTDGGAQAADSGTAASDPGADPASPRDDTTEVARATAAPATRPSFLDRVTLPTG